MSLADSDALLRSRLLDLIRVAREAVPVELAASALRGADEASTEELVLAIDRLAQSTPAIDVSEPVHGERRLALAGGEGEGAADRVAPAGWERAVDGLITACRGALCTSKPAARTYALRHLPRHLADAAALASDPFERARHLEDLLVLAEDATFLAAQAAAEPPGLDEATLELAFVAAFEGERPVAASRLLMRLAERSADRETPLEALRDGWPERALAHLALLPPLARLEHALRLALVATAGMPAVAVRALSVAEEASATLRQVDDPVVLDDLERVLPSLASVDRSRVLAIAERTPPDAREKLRQRLAGPRAPSDPLEALDTDEAPTNSLLEAACRSVERGEPDRALELLTGRPPDGRRVAGPSLDDVLDTARHLVEQGRADAAASLTRMAPLDPTDRVLALADVFRMLAKAGAQPLAQACLDEAREGLERLPPDDTVEGELGVIRALAVQDAWQAAAKLVDAMPAHRQAEAHATLARAALDAGALDEAERALTRSDAAREHASGRVGRAGVWTPSPQVEAWCELASAYAEGGEADRAVAALRRAAPDVRKRHHLEAFARAAGRLAAATDRKRVEEALGPLTADDGSRAHVAVEVARELAEQGRLDEAFEETRTIDDPEARALALLHLTRSTAGAEPVRPDHPWILEALHLLERGDDDDIEALLGSRGDGETRRAEIAAALADLGLEARAFELLDDTDMSATRRVDAFLGLADALAARGRTDAAVRAVDAVFPYPGEADLRAGAWLERCAVALASYGRHTEAMRRVAAWPEPSGRGGALVALAPFLATPDDRRGSCDVANGIDMAGTRRSTRRRLLEDLARRGDVTAEELETLSSDDGSAAGADVVARAAAQRGERAVFARVAPQVARFRGEGWVVVFALCLLHPEAAGALVQPGRSTPGGSR
jgi:hypothetical protein